MAAYAANMRSADDKVGHRLYWSESDEPVSFKGKFDGRIGAGVLVFCMWVWLGLLWLTSPAAHRPTDRKLLLVFMAVSAAPLAAVVAFGNVRGPVSLTFLAAFFGALYLPRISAQAPASHWIYAFKETGLGKYKLPILLAAGFIFYVLVISFIL
jgi:hypothetical protein